MRRRTLIRGAAAVVLAPAGLAAATSAAAAPRPDSAQADDLVGVDVSNYQVGFDYARAAREGLDFVVAKAGGASSPRAPTPRIPTPATSTAPAQRACGSATTS